MEDCLTGSGVSHIPHQRRRKVRILAEKTGLSQQVVSQDYGLVNIVPGLLFADNRADQYPVGLGRQPCALHQPLMARMGDIATLVGNNTAPAPLCQGLSQLPRGLPEPVKGRVNLRRIHQSYLARDKPVLVGKSSLDTGVRNVRCAVNLGSKEFPIIRINFFDIQNCQRLGLVGEEYRVAFLQAQIVYFGFGKVKNNWNAPNVATGQGHVPGHRVQVGGAHEPLQRREEAIGNIHAFSRYLVADRNTREVCNDIQVARSQRGNPLYKHSAVGGKAIVNQLFPSPRP